jgi:hypothetical protein
MPRGRLARTIAAAWLLCIAGCGSSGGSPDAGDAGLDGEGGAPACGVGGQFAGSHMPNDPCAVDSDCHDPYLECATARVTTCRSPDGGAANGACLVSSEENVPICPMTAAVSVKLCAVRYRSPCDGDTDCGPTGFGCVAGLCTQTKGLMPCGSAADCPMDWQCVAPCPCDGVQTEPAACYPPFAIFSCPACVDGGEPDAPATDAPATDATDTAAPSDVPAPADAPATVDAADAPSDSSGSSSDAPLAHGCAPGSAQCGAGMSCTVAHNCCPGSGSDCLIHVIVPGSPVVDRQVPCATDDMCLSSEYCQAATKCCPVGYLCDLSVDAAGQ